MTSADSDLAQATPLTARAATWLARLGLGGVVLYATLFGWHDASQAIQSLLGIGGQWFAWGLLATIVGLGLRASRWLMLLRLSGPAPRWWNAVVIYVAGIGLTATPGKAGEALRSAFARPFGVPVGNSLMATFMDRLSDLIAMVLMAACAAYWSADPGHHQWTAWWLALGLALTAASFALRGALGSAWWPSLQRALARPRVLRWAATWVAHGASAYTRAWHTRWVAASVLVSVAAFGSQAAVFAAMVRELVPHVSVGTAVAVFASSTLAGAASMIPGGLGAMELAMVWQLRERGVAGADATALALAIRMVTFWWGLLLGAIALAAVAKVRHHEPARHESSH